MKQKAVILLAVISLAVLSSCGKGGADKPGLNPSDGPVKYAKASVSVFKDQDLKTWGSNLSKTEPVTLLETMKVQVKGAETEVAKVKLSDGTIMYINNKNLADKPVVFMEDTKAYVRNNASSKVYAVIPKGTIAFVVQEMGDWAQVYAGQIDGKWITQQWVNGGYTSEDGRIQEAKNFEEAAAVLKNSKSKPDQKSQALAVLKEISESSGIFSEAAKSILASNSGESTDSSGNNADGGGTAYQEVKVDASAGLTMREQPGTSSKSIVVIPNGSTVKILNKGNLEENIAGKTASWYEVEWNGNKGWVFGGFLAF
jgi:SH3-like domain-containing protein